MDEILLPDEFSPREMGHLNPNHPELLCQRTVECRRFGGVGHRAGSQWQDAGCRCSREPWVEASTHVSGIGGFAGEFDSRNGAYAGEEHGDAGPATYESELDAAVVRAVGFLRLCHQERWFQRERGRISGREAVVMQ